MEVALRKAAETGEVTAPEGVTPEQAYRAVKAYVAFADEHMSDLGTYSEALAVTLDPADQIAACIAVVERDTAKLRHYAAKGIDNLASLPVKDPEGFTRFIDQRFPGLDVEVRNGRTVVNVEGRGYVAWDVIVRQGWLTKARLAV